MNNDNRGVLHGSSLLEKIAPRHSPGSFFWCLWWDGGSQPPPLHLSLFFLFIVVFFLLNGVPEVGTCPISPSLQLLGVVVRTEKYGRVKHKALNAIMAAFPLGTSVFSVVLFYFSTFLLRGTIWSVTTSGRLPPLSSTTSMLRRILPMAENELFLRLGPWPNVGIDVGLLVFYPHIIYNTVPTFDTKSFYWTQWKFIDDIG